MDQFGKSILGMAPVDQPEKGIFVNDLAPFVDVGPQVSDYRRHKKRTHRSKGKKTKSGKVKDGHNVADEGVGAGTKGVDNNADNQVEAANNKSADDGVEAANNNADDGVEATNNNNNNVNDQVEVANNNNNNNNANDHVEIANNSNNSASDQVGATDDIDANNGVGVVGPNHNNIFEIFGFPDNSILFESNILEKYYSKRGLTVSNANRKEEWEEWLDMRILWRDSYPRISADDDDDDDDGYFDQDEDLYNEEVDNVLG